MVVVIIIIIIIIIITADTEPYFAVGTILSTLNLILITIYEMGPIVILILQTKKLRHREVKYQESHS